MRKYVLGLLTVGIALVVCFCLWPETGQSQVAYTWEQWAITNSRTTWKIPYTRNYVEKRELYSLFINRDYEPWHIIAADRTGIIWEGWAGGPDKVFSFSAESGDAWLEVIGRAGVNRAQTVMVGRSYLWLFDDVNGRTLFGEETWTAKFYAYVDFDFAKLPRATRAPLPLEKE